MNDQNLPVEGEGFIRITTEEFKNNLTGIMMLVSLEKMRFLVQKDEKDIAAVISCGEFEKFQDIIDDIKPSQYLPYEEDCHDDDICIHGVYWDDFLESFETILKDVFYEEQCFGLMASKDMDNFDKSLDIFMPTAIVMSANWFWVSEYYIAEHQEYR
ncbi:MAG TPA: hypothetical protein V6D13_04780 [Halomicronema sp.]